jgi:hypothetical protein
MSKIPNGGPAFPIPDLSNYEGMYLRDYFAAAALQGMWSGGFIRAKPSEPKEYPPIAEYEDIARWAYKQADAMLAERAAAETNQPESTGA